MKIMLPDGNYLLISGNNISHSDLSGKVDLMEEVIAFLRSRGVHPEIESIGSLRGGPFRVMGEETFTYRDIVKLACFLAKRAVN